MSHTHLWLVGVNSDKDNNIQKQGTNRPNFGQQNGCE